MSDFESDIELDLSFDDDDTQHDTENATLLEEMPVHSGFTTVSNQRPTQHIFRTSVPQSPVFEQTRKDADEPMSWTRQIISLFILCSFALSLLYSFILTLHNLQLHSHDPQLFDAISVDLMKIPETKPPADTASPAHVALPPQHFSARPFEHISELYTEEEDTDDMNAIPYPPPEQTYYRRAYVRSMINHAWDSYYARCPGFDEIKPISGGCFNWLKNGSTAVDSSSLFLILNDTTRYEQTTSITMLLDPSLTEQQQMTAFKQHFKAAPAQSGHFSSTERTVSFFETTIRILAGFLSQYELSKNPTFLRKAIEVADGLMPAFDHSQSGFPFSSVDLITGKATGSDWSQNSLILADVGTIVLEFCGLTSAILSYQDQLRQHYNIESPYNLANSTVDWRDPTKRLYRNPRTKEDIIYAELTSIYAPFEYCARAHHVTSLLHATAYTQTSSQFTGLYPHFVATSPSALAFTSTTTYPQPATTSLDADLRQWYKAREKALRSHNKVSPKNGLYTTISDQVRLPFSPTMLIQSIHSYNTTNEEIPPMYNQVSADWVNLFHSPSLFTDALSKYPDSVTPALTVVDNPGRLEKTDAIQAILTNRTTAHTASQTARPSALLSPLTPSTSEDDSQPCGLEPTPSCTAEMVPSMFNDVLGQKFSQLYSPTRLQALANFTTAQQELWKQSTPVTDLDTSAPISTLPTPPPLPTSLASLYKDTAATLAIKSAYTYSVGPMSDSLYEYFLKFWILSGKKNPIYLDLYLKSVRGAFELVYREYTPPQSDLISFRDSRRVNRMYARPRTTVNNSGSPDQNGENGKVDNTTSLSGPNVSQYFTAKPATISSTFHRTDTINLATHHTGHATTLYPSHDFLLNRTKSWVTVDSLGHDVPLSSALSNPKVVNRAMKWLTTQNFGMMVDGQPFSDHMLTKPFRVAGQASVMNHLSCFFPGLLALGLIHGAVPVAQREEHLLKAESLMRGCVRGYLLNPTTGLAPEVYAVSAAGTFNTHSSHPNFNLRPETLESLYLLYRYTGNQVYRELSWLIIENLNRYCRVAHGFTNLGNVFTKTTGDRQETFLLAEVLKYAYLTFEEGEKEPIDGFNNIKVPYNLNFTTSFVPSVEAKNQQQSAANPYSIFFDPDQTTSAFGIHRLSENSLWNTHQVKITFTHPPPTAAKANTTNSNFSGHSEYTRTEKPITPQVVPTESTHKLWDLTKFVFNTEAHPLPVRDLHIDTMLLGSLSSEQLQEFILRHSP